MNQREAQKRLLAAKALLLEPTTTREKFTHIRNLIEGVSPKVDAALAEADRAISTVEKVIAGDVIQLSAEHLPENTEEEKRRKRALLLFIGSWNKLKSEVARVEKELESAEHGDAAHQASVWGKIFGLAKGPFGIITIAAVGIVIAMQATSVHISIYNNGCPTMHLATSIPISLPGLSLPTDPVASGQSVTATIPPLPVQVDGTDRSTLTLSTLTLTMTFSLPSNVTDVTMNGASLLGKTTNINLVDHKQHTLEIKCS